MDNARCPHAGMGNNQQLCHHNKASAEGARCIRALTQRGQSEVATERDEELLEHGLKGSREHGPRHPVI